MKQDLRKPLLSQDRKEIKRLLALAADATKMQSQIARQIFNRIMRIIRNEGRGAHE